MEILRKKQIKAYILLESLMAMSILVIIVSMIVGEINHNRRILIREFQQEEALVLARMTIQTHQKKQELNGVTISIKESDKAIIVYQSGKEILNVYQK